MNNERISVIIAIGSLFLCAPIAPAREGDTKTSVVRYVAIGDSYTIGEGAKPEEAWPNILTRHLKEKGVNIELIANPSRTGWTTQNAIDRELPVFTESKPTFATLLIGVNDWVQQVDEKTFRHRFVTLVERMLALLPEKK